MQTPAQTCTHMNTSAHTFGAGGQCKAQAYADDPPHRKASSSEVPFSLSYMRLLSSPTAISMSVLHIQAARTLGTFKQQGHLAHSSSWDTWHIQAARTLGTFKHPDS